MPIFALKLARFFVTLRGVNKQLFFIETTIRSKYSRQEKDIDLLLEEVMINGDRQIHIKFRGTF